MIEIKISFDPAEAPTYPAPAETRQLRSLLNRIHQELVNAKQPHLNHPVSEAKRQKLEELARQALQILPPLDETS